jgi:translation initiation factor 1
MSSNYVKSTNWVAIIRVEKNGRGGKVVTVIDQLPKHEQFLKELAKDLKVRCGVGGTYLMDRKDGVIEIQGDKAVDVQGIFEKKGYKSKRL